MNSTTLLILAAPLMLVALSHLLVHVFMLVRLPKVAAAIAKYTPTVTALLPAIEDQVIGGPSLIVLAKDLDAAAKADPTNDALALFASRVKRLAGGVVVTMLVLLLVGCSAGPKILHTIQLSSSAVVVAEPCLVKAYELEQQACLDDTPTDLAKARTCVSDVRARWKDVAAGFTDLRNVRCEIEPQKCAGAK